MSGCKRCIATCILFMIWRCNLCIYLVHFASLSVPTRLARRHFAVYAACTQCTSLFLHNPSTLEFYRNARFADEVQTLLHLSIPNTYCNPTVCLLCGVQRTLCIHRACVACPTVLGNHMLLYFTIPHLLQLLWSKLSVNGLPIDVLTAPDFE